MVKITKANLGLWLDYSHHKTEDLDEAIIRAVNYLLLTFMPTVPSFDWSSDEQELRYSAEDAISFANSEILGNSRFCENGNYQFEIDDNSLYLVDTTENN